MKKAGPTMWTNKQFWLDSSWRSFRTFCQSMAGLLLTVQTSAQLGGEISVPWYGYVYASGVAGLISLLQSVDRERAVDWVQAETTSATPAAYVTEVEPDLQASYGHGYGEDLR